MGSVQEEKPPEAPKTRIHELRNSELVSRFLAATPPYLYSALPLQPHAFFFSEMLRSFVNARHGCRPPQYHRRFKRRSHKYFAENESEPWQPRREWQKPEEEKKEAEVPRAEGPLELTVDKHTKVRDVSPRAPSPKPEPKAATPPPPGRPSSFVDVGVDEGLPKPSPCIGRNLQDPQVPPSNLILPPPPPMWYPPIYNPQFGVDPLNFFIDLRVSGHIYDRKRLAEGAENSEKVDEGGLDKRLGRDFGRPRHVSAFSVPVRSTNVTVDAPAKYFDTTRSEKGPLSGKVNGTSYIMRNLKRVYEHLHTSQESKVEAKVMKVDDSKEEESSDINDDDIID